MPSKQIGWSNESNLLYTISSQISRLAGIIATSGGGGGGTITGGGASGQVTFWDAATNITGSNNLFWDAAQNRLGIGTNTPQTSGELATSGARLRFNQTVGGSIFHGIEFATNGTVYSSLLANQNTGEVRLSTNESYFPTFYASGSEGMRLTTNRNLIIQNGGTFTDDNTNRLQVSGSGKFSLNQNTSTQLTVSNTNVNAAAASEVQVTTNGGTGVFGKYSTLGVPVKIITASNTYLYNGVTAGDIAILNDFATGTIKFATGGVSTAQMVLHQTGNLSLGSTTDDNTNRLQVLGNAKITGDLSILANSSGSTISSYNATSSTIFLGNTASGTVAFELQTGSTRRFRIFATATSTTFESSNQTGAFIFNKDVSVSGKISVLSIVPTSGISVAIENGTEFVFGNGGPSSAFTRISLSSTYTIASGTNTSNGIRDSAVINISGTAVADYVSFNATPTINGLGATGTYKAFQWTNNTGWGLYGSGTAPNYLGGDLAVAGVLRETVTTNRQTVSYTLVLTDRGKLVETNVGAANTITVPPNSSIAFPIGTKIDIAQYGAGQTTIVPGIGVTVRSAGGALKLSAQYSGATIVKIGTDEWYLFGDITV